MIFNIPIEDLEERYSSQWNNWFPREFEKFDIDYLTLYGECLTNRIEKGSFLDVCGTNYFKADQLKQIVSFVYSGQVKDKDIFFFHDLWFPGIEMLSYMRDGLGIDFKIYGCLHAGTYDPYDFLSQKGMRKWAEFLEKSWFEIIDGIFVATEFHKRILVERRCVDDRKIFVTGFPIYDENSNKSIEKENIVVFPHRLDSEKNPHLFDLLRRKLCHKYKKWWFLKTKEVCDTKSQYYRLLDKSKIAVSFADQETWGIAMQETMFAGCIPVVPDKLSYVELYDEKFRFDSFKSAILRIESIINNVDSELRSEILSDNLRRLTIKGSEAIYNMLNIMLNRKE